MVGFITAYTKPRVCNASANLDSGGWSNCCSYVGIIGSIASRQFGFDYCMLRSRYRWDISSAQCNTQSQNRGAVGSSRQAANLEGESPLPSIARFRRLAYPTCAE